MGWLLRFPAPDDGDTGAEDRMEITGAALWDLGTQGWFETGGEVVAGFATEADAMAAADGLGLAGYGTSWFVDPAPAVPALPVEQQQVEVVHGPPERAGRFRLVPGGAFGHGGHPTTRVVLDLMTGLDLGGLRVLDLGTGTGVLAIAAGLAGADEVVAVDNDPVAVASARANVAANVGAGLRSGVISVGDGPVERLAESDLDRFDVVLMNVLLPVHRDLAPVVTDMIRPGGSMITAGYLDDQENELLACHRTRRPARRIAMHGWVGHLLVG